jgi:D-alanine-D-alanine ligase
MNIAILYDRVIDDASRDAQDILAQAESVFMALSELGHTPMHLTISLHVEELQKALKQAETDIVFNLVESVHGDGQLIYIVPAFLDHLGIPYTGSTTESLILTSNKIFAKKLLKASTIATPRCFSFESPLKEDTPFMKRYIFKSIWEHASIGIDANAILFIENEGQIIQKMGERRETLGKDVFAEEYIEGREFNISLLEAEHGPELLPPAEIRFEGYPAQKPKIVDYNAKWDEKSFEYLHTSRSFDFSQDDAPLLEEIAHLAKECWNIFGLQGYGRIDFRVDITGKPWVIDINANPCIAPDGGFVAATQQAGIPFNQVIRRIMNTPGFRDKKPIRMNLSSTTKITKDTKDGI